VCISRHAFECQLDIEALGILVAGVLLEFAGLGMMIPGLQIRAQPEVRSEDGPGSRFTGPQSLPIQNSYCGSMADFDK
jgi:hypothetical protein